MIPALTNHLWQSTVFAIAAGLLTLVLRRNHARVRYWLWLTASLKFLVPFQLLARLGRHLAWHRIYAASPPVASAIMQFSQPYPPVRHALAPAPAIPNLTPIFIFSLWICGSAAVLLVWIWRWRRTAAIIHAAAPLTEGREAETLRRLDAEIPIVSSTAPLEPGVFGIWKPILFLPARISELLDDAQLEAILAHEAGHVRRRDNLTAALHMLVESVFWFHPLVWWIGARLIEERENACDEAVLRSQNQPDAYAEGILKVCEYCLEAPRLCVSGVSGADLKKRVQSIVANHSARDLGWPRRLLLAIAAIGAIAAPIGMGILNPHPSLARPQAATAPLPQFEVATIKPSSPDGRGTFIRPPANSGISLAGVPLKEIIVMAWQVQPFQVSGGPSWIESAPYDISAKADHQPKPDEIGLMLQSLLADRFQLKIHHETKELPIYALVLANKGGKLGPQLTESKEGSCTPFDPSKPRPPFDPSRPPVLGCGQFMMGFDRLTTVGAPISRMTPLLARILGRTIEDKTGLTGNFDIKMQWTPDQAQLQLMAPPGGLPPGMPAPQFDPNGPSIFTALQEQLGLKLESQKGPVDILVIDHVEKPSEN